MRIWGISDLHLSFSANKPMDIFDAKWKNHAEKMKESWDKVVDKDDVVLCPGDLSWAMRLSEAKLDLDWIGERPGLKILGRGNHDYWWSSISKVRQALPEKCLALQHDSIDLGPVVVAGSRCWTAPGGLDYTAADQKIYERELKRLELSLESARKLSKDKLLIASIHYPPFKANKKPTGFVELLEKYNVSICVYGHLHGEHAHRTSVEGEIGGIRYIFIACDFLDFKPKLIWE